MGKVAKVCCQSRGFLLEERFGRADQTSHESSSKESWGLVSAVRVSRACNSSQGCFPVAGVENQGIGAGSPERGRTSHPRQKGAFLVRWVSQVWKPEEPVESFLRGLVIHQN